MTKNKLTKVFIPLALNISTRETQRVNTFRAEKIRHLSQDDQQVTNFRLIFQYTQCEGK